MELFRGLAYPARGFVILRRYPGLARYWLPPIVLTFLALVASVALAFAYHDDVLALLWRAPAQDGVTGALLCAAYWLARVFSLLLGITVLVVACVLLSSLIAAPFNDLLSEAVEVREAGRELPPFSIARLLTDLGRTVRLELLKLCVYAIVMGPLLVLSWLVPGVGQALYVAFGILFTSAYFAFDYIDWPASRHNYGIRERARLFASHPLRMFGFGLGVWACLFVPLLNLAFMPLAVAGGTRLFLDITEERGPGHA